MRWISFKNQNDNNNHLRVYQSFSTIDTATTTVIYFFDFGLNENDDNNVDDEKVDISDQAWVTNKGSPFLLQQRRQQQHTTCNAKKLRPLCKTTNLTPIMQIL